MKRSSRVPVTPTPTRCARGPGWRRKWGGGLGLACLLGAVLLFLLLPERSIPPETRWSAIRTHIHSGQVTEVRVLASELRIEGQIQEPSRPGRPFTVVIPTEQILTDLCGELDEWNRAHPDRAIEITVVGMPDVYLLALVQMMPWLLIGGVLTWLLVRQIRSSTSHNAAALPRGESRWGKGELPKVTFDDVAGAHEAKEDMYEIIQFLREPGRFRKLGARLPRGALLVGPPGTGKTLLARAVAGEAGVPFFSLSGSDFVEMFVGVGASRVRELFRQAREQAPAIIFLDEIDAVGRRRGPAMGSGSEEREQTLNAILVEMDGFDSDTGIIVVAATNRPDVLDPALLRPGRFDREIEVPLPDRRGRREILEVHLRGVPVEPDLDVDGIARGTPSFSGAELEALINEAALVAAGADRSHVTAADFEDGRDRVRWGRARQSLVLEAEDRRITAFHEAGHALLARLCRHSEPLHKVTIIPRGPSLGSTLQLPQRDRYNLSRAEVFDTLVVLFGGRIAEQRFCGDASTGAANDLQRAAELARRMVCEWGMSRLGPGVYGHGADPEHAAGGVPLSEETRREIDREIRRIIDEAHADAEEIIARHDHELEAIAESLLLRETLTAEDVRAIIDGTVADRAPNSDPDTGDHGVEGVHEPGVTA